MGRRYGLQRQGPGAAGQLEQEDEEQQQREAGGRRSAAHRTWALGGPRCYLSRTIAVGSVAGLCCGSLGAPWWPWLSNGMPAALARRAFLLSAVLPSLGPLLLLLLPLLLLLLLLHRLPGTAMAHLPLAGACCNRKISVRRQLACCFEESRCCF